MTRMITICPVLNGYVLTVGCQTIVFDSAKKMLDELGQYYAAPEAVEQRFLKNAVNKTMLEPHPPMETVSLTVGSGQRVAETEVPAGRPC